MRLVDADATIKEIKARNPDDVSYEDAWAITCIEHAPTIEPRKKGMWIAHPDDAFDEWFCCSVCHKGLTMFDGTYNFCPNCGADMREPEDIPMEYFESGGR